jgi:hypothetical protein
MGKAAAKTTALQMLRHFLVLQKNKLLFAQFSVILPIADLVFVIFDFW